MIEARIVVANNNFQRELGIRWGVDGTNVDGSTTVDYAGDVNLPTTGNPAGTLDLGVLTNNEFLDMELTALENSGHAEVVSQPKVITSDKQTASIRSGKEIAYQEGTTAGNTSTTFKEAVLLLEVTPQITPDNNIIMDLSVSKDALGNIVNGIPSIDVTRLETKVLVKNGQTVVLGGVFSIDTAKSESKVPVLGDVPFLGRLFKRTLTRTDKSELLIFITPRLLAESLDK
jgi:type IV pilus assembly protein PilQ